MKFPFGLILYWALCFAAGWVFGGRSDVKQYLIAFVYVLSFFLAGVAIAATLFPVRWHEMTW